MSAFSLERDHIDVLIATALHGPSDPCHHDWGALRWTLRDWREGDTLDDVIATSRRLVTADTLRSMPGDVAPDEVGDRLLWESARSATYRCPEEAVTALAKTCPGWLLPYRYREPGIRLGVVAALKAIDGYEHRSCDHPDWPFSEARRFCDALRRRLIAELAGYDQAPSDWDAATIELHRRGHW